MLTHSRKTHSFHPQIAKIIFQLRYPVNVASVRFATETALLNVKLTGDNAILLFAANCVWRPKVSGEQSLLVIVDENPWRPVAWWVCGVWSDLWTRPERYR